VFAVVGLVLAAAEFRRALALDPRLAAAVAYLGMIAHDEGRKAEAESAYRRALELDPKCAEARVGLARGAARPEALRELRRAVAERPDHRMARYELAVLLSQPPENWPEAAENWRALVALDADDRDAQHGLAQACEKLGQWAEAERHYREVLRIGQTPADLDVWVYSVNANVGEMCEKQGEYREAIQAYEALLAAEGAGAEEVHNARVSIERLRKRLEEKP
jgi:tetratricopeptide (TPR) repeat protein